MAVKGVFASHQNVVGSRKGDFASGLLQTMPTGTAPLFALTSGMKSRDATETIVTWFEETKLSGRVNVTNNATTGVTLTIDDISQIRPGDILLVEATGEYVFVDSISGSDATVVRAYAGSNTSINGSSEPVPVQRITNAVEEGSSKPDGIANVGFPNWNYMQIVRDAWDVTGSAKAIDYHTGDLVAKNRADCLFLHGENIERAFIWGVRGIGSRNGKSYRTMAGIKQQLVTNQASQSTNTSWIDVRTFFQDVFTYNVKGLPNERIAFCGNTVVAVVEDMARLDSQINITPGQTEFGMEIFTLRTPFGTVKLMTHPLFTESPLFTEDLLVIHPGVIEVRYLRRTVIDDYDKNGTRAGVDADFGVATTELTVTYGAERTGGYYTGIDTAVAS